VLRKRQSKLLQSQRFLPLFITQSLGAFNDNLYKNAIVFLVTFGIAIDQSIDSKILIPMAGGIFILPFFLFSATAGQIADKYDKAFLIRIIKFVEIILMVLASAALILQNIPLLKLLLFMMGLQSTFFGPVKFSILPDHLDSNELIQGNAWVEAGTFIAILLGTLVSKFVLDDNGVFIISSLMILVALIGYFSSRQIPSTKPLLPNLKLTLNPFSEAWTILSYCYSKRDVFWVALAISWFWLVGSIFLITIPTLTKGVIGGNENLVAFFMIIFSMGIGIGSLLCNRMLKGLVHAAYVPLAGLGISLFSIDLYFATYNISPTPETLGVASFLENGGLRTSIDILLISISGGIFIVPLQALMQLRSESTHRSRNIAANNIINSLFMVVAAIAVVVAYEFNVTVPEIILTLASLNAMVAIYITRFISGSIAKALLAWILDLFYRVEIKGIENFYAAGDKVLIVANHQSFLDPALIGSYIPETLTFAINTEVSKNKVVQYFMSLARTIAVDPSNSLSLRSLIDAINNNEKVVIFPEGRITVTGSLMKIYEGPGIIADKANAVILPVRIEGAQYSPFSYLKGKVRIRLFPKVKMTFLPAENLAIPEALKGRARRHYSSRRLQEIMTGLMFENSSCNKTLFQSLLDAKYLHGSSHEILEDVKRNTVGYKKIISSSFVIGKTLSVNTKEGTCVGVLLPNSESNVSTFFGLLAYGRVPAMIDFSSSKEQVISACEIANVKRVITSRRFIEAEKLDDVVDGLKNNQLELVYIEDILGSLTLTNKIFGLMASNLGGVFYHFSGKSHDVDSPAVVLFSSEDGGEPKAIILSHNNIQSHLSQMRSMIDFVPNDIVFNALPMFDSTGLASGTLLPILSGLKVVLYPSPLHYSTIPEIIYDSNATLLFSTDTFLKGYSRFAHSYDFFSVRYVFSGSETLADETKKKWIANYGVRIFESYGSTEAVSLLSMNTPMFNKVGSVGKFAPGLKYRFDPVSEDEKEGHLWVKGPNIMSSYMSVSNPGVFQQIDDAWYDTGDIVSIDSDGFVFLKD